MSTVIAVDPGKTTGVAMWDDVLGFKSKEVPGGLMGALNDIRPLLHRSGALVYEKFEIMASTVRTDLTEAYTTLYINGALLVAAHDVGCYVHEQRPKDKLFAMGNRASTLKAVDWYKTEGDGHANDAAAHLLKFLVDTRRLPSNLFSKIIDMELGL